MNQRAVRLTFNGVAAGQSPSPEGHTLLLVLPPQHGLLEGFSSGLVSLANYVGAELPNVHVHLLDLGVASEEQARHEIESQISNAETCLFVGITATTASYQGALQVARMFKALAPSCVTIMGGHHASAQDSFVLRNDVVDFVVRGEGERALVELLHYYPHVKSVPNLSYMRGLEIQRNEAAPLLDQNDLDRIPVMFSGWGLRSAPGKFDHVTYVSARGCPLKCHFCAVANEQIRHKSIGAVIKDLRLLVGEMGYRRIAIEDNFFAHSPKRTVELCRAIEELQKELPFRWDCQTRVESCQHEVAMEAMERAACEAVYIGVESFDPEQLLYLNKTRQPGSYLNLLRDKVVPWFLESTIQCYINLQLGLPGEEEHHRLNTLKALSNLGRQAEEYGRTITVFPMLHVVYPGTTHFHHAQLEGRFGNGPDAETVFERFTAWEARQQPILRWMGDHFAHGTGGIPEGILDTDRLRTGEFSIAPNAVMAVVNYLLAIEKIPGIQVFQYGAHVVGTSSSASLGENLPRRILEQA